MQTVKVNKRGADRVRAGHLWIYRSDVVDVAAEGGSVVRVTDERGNFVGQALFSDASQIALRFLTQSNEDINRDWWRRRIVEAAERRNIPPDTNAYRLIYSEGDLLPSLIVDRYDDVLVLQTLSQGTDALKPLLTGDTDRRVCSACSCRTKRCACSRTRRAAAARRHDLWQCSGRTGDPAARVAVLCRAFRWTEDRIVSRST